MDALSLLFQTTGLSASVFFTGALCNAAAYESNLDHGHLHVLRAGRLRLTAAGHSDRVLDQPSVILLPRSIEHALVPMDSAGADLVCGAIDLGLTAHSPLNRVLPAMMTIPIERLPAITASLQLLFNEVGHELAGRQAAVDRLVQYVLIQLLRELGREEGLSSGLLAGLSDDRLSRALTQMHQHPARPWTLQQLADLAIMSRARFAAHFLTLMGQTAMDYLTDWRMTLAQKCLLQGQSVKVVSANVGYQSTAAFIRVFNRRIGEPPAGWATKRRRNASA